MAPKVGINGFGRIGRLVLRAAIAKGVEVSNYLYQDIITFISEQLNLYKVLQGSKSFKIHLFQL